MRMAGFTPNCGRWKVGRLEDWKIGDNMKTGLTAWSGAGKAGRPLRQPSPCVVPPRRARPAGRLRSAASRATKEKVTRARSGRAGAPRTGLMGIYIVSCVWLADHLAPPAAKAAGGRWVDVGCLFRHVSGSAGASPYRPNGAVWHVPAAAAGPAAPPYRSEGAGWYVTAAPAGPAVRRCARKSIFCASHCIPMDTAGVVN